MTPIDDFELGQRLRALRVDPPDGGFEARLAARLAASSPEPVVPAPRAVLPFRRRRPLLLLAAAAVSLAGAAAALEVGLVDWLRAQVGGPQTADERTAPQPEPARPRQAPAAPDEPARTDEVLRDTPPKPLPAPPEPPARLHQPPLLDTPPAPLPLPPPTGGARGSVPRLGLEGSRRQPVLPTAPLTRPSAPLVPRVALEPRTAVRPDPVGRAGRVGPGASGVVERERGRELERLRDIGRLRRERTNANPNERPHLLERVRERREKSSIERRETSNERQRRERPGR